MKKQLKAARLNSILIRYIIVLLISAVFLGLIGLGINYYMDMTQNSMSGISSQNGKTMSNEDMMAKVNEINPKVSSVKSAVDSGNNYSQVLIELGQKLPTGVILDSINLSDNELAKSLELTFYAKNNDAARRIKSQLSNSNILTNVSEATITTVANPPFSGYPVKAVVSLLVNGGAI